MSLEQLPALLDRARERDEQPITEAFDDLIEHARLTKDRVRDHAPKDHVLRMLGDLVDDLQQLKDRIEKSDKSAKLSV